VSTIQFSGKYYTGIGSRAAPGYILDMMKEIGTMNALKGHILRSGGAGGADTAFENGHKQVTSDHMEIYIHKEGFMGRSSKESCVYLGTCINSMILAKKHYLPPKEAPWATWDKMKSYTKGLMARNGYQVLGRNLDTPSIYTVCWTKDAEHVGGTRQAMYVSEAYDVPVYNLADPKIYSSFRYALDEFFKNLDRSDLELK